MSQACMGPMGWPTWGHRLLGGLKLIKFNWSSSCIVRGPRHLEDWCYVAKLCGLIAIGPTLDQARRYATDELLTSLDIVDSNKDQTLDSRVWIMFKFMFGKILALVKRCGIPGGVESIVVVTPKDCSI